MSKRSEETTLDSGKAELERQQRIEKLEKEKDELLAAHIAAEERLKKIMKLRALEQKYKALVDQLLKLQTDEMLEKARIKPLSEKREVINKLQPSFVSVTLPPFGLTLGPELIALGLVLIFIPGPWQIFTWITYAAIASIVVGMVITGFSVKGKIDLDNQETVLREIKPLCEPTLQREVSERSKRMEILNKSIKSLHSEIDALSIELHLPTEKVHPSAQKIYLFIGYKAVSRNF